MRNFNVIKYSSLFYNEWNNFVAKSKNATFLFHRDFMGYHADRYEDYSLLVFKEDVLIAILPANKVNNEIYSHQGLSYGGLVLERSVKMNVVLKAFLVILKYLNEMYVESLILKQMPLIYNISLSDELDYFLFILKAELFRKDTLSVVDMKNKVEVSKDRVNGLKRAKRHNLVVRNSEDFLTFWEEILTKNLKKRYDTLPVHSYEEIILLKEKFPKNIQLFNVYKNEKIVAGTVVFESENVAHSQYISADEDRSNLGSLDILHFHLINNVYFDKLYFDFGNSNINFGKQINKGLQSWKEGFGARTITQSFYKVDVRNFELLERILV